MRTVASIFPNDFHYAHGVALRVIFEFFKPLFVMFARLLAADLGAVMGPCLTGSLLLPYLARKRARSALACDRVMFGHASSCA